jgi:hypothetical protein
MNLLREEFCKETNTPMGLDDVYNYVKWLENKRSTSFRSLLKCSAYRFTITLARLLLVGVNENSTISAFVTFHVHLSEE